MADKWLFFVDTNIFLDFYRQSGESAARQLAALERHKDRLITGDQVRMEFLKNRQQVIIKALRDLKQPNQESVPQIFNGTKAAEMMTRHQKAATQKFKEIKEKAEKILSDPSRHDRVFQTFNRIFNSNAKINLCRPKKERFQIRNLARKRFVLGYPPRKGSDTSIGDAINWEWLIYCAQHSDAQPNIMIVSRDSDYGAQNGNDSFLNDWLLREFKDRVGGRRKIVLTAKLTQALKLMEEVVTAEDEREELILIGGSRKVKFADLLKYMRRGAASRLLLPDPEIEMFFEMDEEIEDAIPEYDEDSAIDDLQMNLPSKNPLD